MNTFVNYVKTLKGVKVMPFRENEVVSNHPYYHVVLTAGELPSGEWGLPALSRILACAKSLGLVVLEADRGFLIGDPDMQVFGTAWGYPSGSPTHLPGGSMSRMRVLLGCTQL